MRHFNAKIRAIKKHSAGIREEKQLTARISLANKMSELKVKFANNSALNGVIRYLPVAICESMKRLQVRLKILSVIAEIFTKNDSRATVAPATDVTVEREIKNDNEISITQANAEEIKVNRSIIIERLKGLVAYNTVLLKYNRESFLLPFVELFGADGKVINIANHIKNNVVVKLFGADGKVVNIVNQVKSAVIASGIGAKAVCITVQNSRFKVEDSTTGGSAPTVDALSETEIFSAAEIEANSAKAISINVSRVCRETASAGLYSWFFPEFESGILSIYQIFGGVQVGDMVEIDLEPNSTYWANATVNDGVLNLVFVESVTPNDNILEVV